MREYTKEEMKWIKRLQRTVDAMPTTLSVFVNESGISVFRDALPEYNEGVDSRVEHEIVRPKRGLWESGAW